MNKLFDFLDKYKFGLLAVVCVYICLYMYLQMETYQKMYIIPIWDERAELEMPEEVEIKSENIETHPNDINPSDIKSISKDMNDDREKTNKDWSPNKSAKQIEKEMKALEKKMFEETGEAQKREKIKQQKAELQKEVSKNSENKSTQNSSGSEKQFSGNVMVEWELKNRQAHQNNSWYIRNPGYTCGSGSNGKVYMKIKVNASGNVLSANYVPEKSVNASACMIEQAKKYALISRFGYDAQAPNQQEGYISYTFISQ